ncbi:hypothetical protein ACLOJK_034646 [Asimina triloba]
MNGWVLHGWVGAEGKDRTGLLEHGGNATTRDRTQSRVPKARAEQQDSVALRAQRDFVGGRDSKTDLDGFVASNSFIVWYGFGETLVAKF